MIISYNSKETLAILNHYQKEISALFHLQYFYFTSPQPIKPNEASDSDFTIEDVMLWPGMRFTLRSRCELCSAGRLHNSLPCGSRSSHSCLTRRSLRIEDRMLPARHGFEPTSSTVTCPASPPFSFHFASTH